MPDTSSLDSAFWSGIFDWYSALGLETSLVLTLVGILIPAVFALRRLRQIAQDTSAHYDWMRKENAINYSISRNEAYRESRLELSRLLGEFNEHQPITLDYWLHCSANDPMVQIHTQVVLGHFENLALAIDEGVVDPRTAFMMLCGAACRTYATFHEVMAYKRKTNPMLYRRFIKLVSMWEPLSQKRLKAYKNKPSARFNLLSKSETYKL